MLSRWLERGLGNIVAPDEKFEAENASAPAEGMSSFWRMVAPDPVYEEQQMKVQGNHPPAGMDPTSTTTTTPVSSPEAAQATAAPPSMAFMSPGFNSSNIRYGRSAEPVAGDLEGFATPSPEQQKQQRANDELEEAVLSAAKGFSKSVFSPPDVLDSNNKVFRLCASGKPLQGKLPQKLENSLVKDKTLLKARAAKLGQLVPDGMTPLMAAAHAGNVGAAKIILTVDKENGHLDRDLLGRTALHIAAQEGNVEIAELLVKEKHEKDSIPPDSLLDLSGRTPFGMVLTSPNPKAKKHHGQLESLLFSPRDISVFGSPPPTMARETIYRSLEMVYGEAEMPGYRVTMEDAVCSESWHDDDSGQFFCLVGVCDGHGDQGKVSQFVSKHIATTLQKQTKGLRMSNDNDAPIDWQKIWTDACLEVDRKLKSAGLTGGSTAVMALITKSHIIVANVGDSRCILIQRKDDNGATSLDETELPPPLVEEKEEDAPTQQQPVSDNDSAADAVTTSGDEREEEGASSTQVAGAETKEQEAGAETEEGNKTTKPREESGTVGFEVVALSEDHKPSLTNERERIEKAGMTVIEQTFEENGQQITIHKVKKNSSSLMAVSRSFGDFEYKNNKELGSEEQAICAVPEVRVHSRNGEKDMYLVLCCDGVYDVMSDDDVAKFIVDQAESVKDAERNEKGRLPEIGDSLLKECLDRGSRDNMTTAICALSSSMDKFTTGAIEGRALNFSSP